MPDCNWCKDEICVNDECPMCCGFYVWQFADIRTCLEAGINRARGFNNKGILNEYRKPKLAYYRVRELYREFLKK